jgi:hypothetical protein
VLTKAADAAKQQQRERFRKIPALQLKNENLKAIQLPKRTPRPSKEHPKPKLLSHELLPLYIRGAIVFPSTTVQSSLPNKKGY